MFIGRADFEPETKILWQPDVKNWHIGKDPDAVKDWRQEEKRTTEDEIVGWHPRLNGHEFERAPGVGEGQGSLACCSSGVTKSWTWLSYRTTATVKLKQRGLRILVGLALGAPSTKTHRQASSLTTAEQCCLDPIQVTSSSLGKLFSLAEKVSFFFLILALKAVIPALGLSHWFW